MCSSITMDDYKLSCELFGHSMDVRSVAAGPTAPETILSGSRDRSVKVWVKEKDGIYREYVGLLNHAKFVTCVYYLESEGWICTGSNDSTICLYKNQSVTPFHILKGHGGNVTSITKGAEAKMLFSGSWDSTGKIWKIDETGTVTYVTLKGHKAAVWAVATLPNGKYATGSADKMIYIWNSKGEKLRILKGHSDCVRGLIALSDCSLVSCGNDAIIRYWNEDGECLHEYCGHSNYIYTIAMGNLGDIFITAGEDSTVRMWSLKDGLLGNPLIIPAESVWSAAFLANGDIVTGSSDGVVRVFTKDPSRVASQSIQNAFEVAVQQHITKINLELGGIKKSDIPGTESLSVPGTEGQKKMVRLPNGNILCYLWENNKWNKVGDVVGASEGSQKKSGKQLFEGKEYDFIFSVDIADGVPALNLPYNKSEDPWQAAQAFIHKHKLPQSYLEQVADFIIANSKGNKMATSTNVDPYTGNSSYSTASRDKNEDTSKNGSKKHFPVEKTISIHNFDANKVYDKLKEFNKKTENSLNVSDDILDIVFKLTDKDPRISEVAVEALEKLLQWPKDILFPVLDVTRLAVRHENICAQLSSSTSFLQKILSNLDGAPPNQLMTVRCLSNMMCHESGRQELEKRLEPIFEAIKCIKSGNDNLQIAISTLFLNATISQIKGVANEDTCQTITEGVITFLCWTTNLEASYRSIQALGNLTSTSFGPILSAQVVSIDIVMDKIREWINGTQMGIYEKLTEASKDLLDNF